MVGRVYIRRNNIEWVAHDPMENLLTISFMSGSLCTFGGFPVPAYEEFLRAHSQAEYLIQKIRGRYPLTLGKGHQ